MRVLSAALAIVLGSFGVVFAQDWPTRPVIMVVPYAAGGPVDAVGRIMAAGLSEALGQPVIVENVAGAGGMTGANRVAKGAPDGYTFLLGGHATLTLVPAINGKKTLYDPAVADGKILVGVPGSSDAIRDALTSSGAVLCVAVVAFFLTGRTRERRRD